MPEGEASRGISDAEKKATEAALAEEMGGTVQDFEARKVQVSEDQEEFKNCTIEDVEKAMRLIKYWTEQQERIGKLLSKGQKAIGGKGGSLQEMLAGAMLSGKGGKII